MKIIIVGDGKVGFTLATRLSEEGHDITVVDNKSEALHKAVESLDVLTVEGNGASFSVLEEAGIKETDLLIAATAMDEVNMLCCLIGKRLGAKRTIAKMRDPDYFDQLESMKEEMGLSMVINPEQAAAEEIMRLITFPAALSIGSFAEGRVYVMEYKISPNGNLAGYSLAEIMAKYYSEILVCAVTRDGKVYIPDGSFVIKPGDHISVTGSHSSIGDFLYKCGQQEKKIKSTIIVGGGHITYYLSKLLIESGYSVKIIENNSSQCENLSTALKGVLVIEGDGTDQELLDAERIDKAGAFVALSDLDEDNLLMSIYAADKGVPKVIARINRTGYADVITKAGVNSVISPQSITANHIVQYVRNMSKRSNHLKSLYLIKDQAELIEFTADDITEKLGIPLSSLKIKPGIIIAAIVRGDKVIIPKGGNKLLSGDRVVISTTVKQMADLREIFPDFKHK